MNMHDVHRSGHAVAAGAKNRGLRELAVRRLHLVRTATALAAGMLCSLALAAGGAPTAATPDTSNAKPVQGTSSGSAAPSDDSRHAVKVRKNERLNHCKSMSGDEKKACQDEAQALAKSERRSALHAHRTGTSSQR